MPDFMFGDARVPTAVWDHVHPEPMSGCWLWSGGLSNGYGMRWQRGVHRIVFDAIKGAPEPGLVVDHICRNRCCVNPDHLRAVTVAVNNANSEYRGLKTHCKYGHEYTAENTEWSSGGSGRNPCRRCRTCRRIAKRAARLAST